MDVVDTEIELYCVHLILSMCACFTCVFVCVGSVILPFALPQFSARCQKHNNINTKREKLLQSSRIVAVYKNNHPSQWQFMGFESVLR